MDIASAVVHAAPGRSAEVRAQLERLRGIEIHAETPEGRFVVTAEDTPEGSAGDAIMAPAPSRWRARRGDGLPVL